MPVYSFITTITAPNLEAAQAAASEIGVSAEEGIEAAIQDGEVARGVEFVRGDLIEGDAQAIIDRFMTALYALEFHDPDAPVNGGDAVETVCEYLADLQLLTTIETPALDEDDDDCAQGSHSWINETGLLPPDTRCTRCGEEYGHPD